MIACAKRGSIIVTRSKLQHESDNQGPAIFFAQWAALIVPVIVSGFIVIVNVGIVMTVMMMSMLGLSLSLLGLSLTIAIVIVNVGIVMTVTVMRTV